MKKNTASHTRLLTLGSDLAGVQGSELMQRFQQHA